MRRAYKSTKSLEEKQRGSKPEQCNGGTQLRFYSKEYRMITMGFYSKPKIQYSSVKGRGKGETDDNEGVRP